MDGKIKYGNGKLDGIDDCVEGKHWCVYYDRRTFLL